MTACAVFRPTADSQLPPTFQTFTAAMSEPRYNQESAWADPPTRHSKLDLETSGKSGAVASTATPACFVAECRCTCDGLGSGSRLA
jgi:hypothetical protein